jgi:hypothetical protein
MAGNAEYFPQALAGLKGRKDVPAWILFGFSMREECLSLNPSGLNGKKERSPMYPFWIEREGGMFPPSEVNNRD